jgi:hypothetical protein
MQTKINRREIINLCADALIELERACRKHPEWPTQLITASMDDLTRVLSIQRECNDNGYGTGVSIFDEEYLEYLEAVMQGDAKAAREEIVQAIAMLLRQYAHLGDYIAQYKAAAAANAQEVPNALPY